jgi:hypothetical protein
VAPPVRTWLSVPQQANVRERQDHCITQGQDKQKDLAQHTNTYEMLLNVIKTIHFNMWGIVFFQDIL